MIPSTHPKTYEIQSLASPQLWKQSAELNSLETGGSRAGSRPMCSNSILASLTAWHVKAFGEEERER